MATQKAEWNSEYVTETTQTVDWDGECVTEIQPEVRFNVKNGEHFLKQLKDTADRQLKGIHVTEDYGSISFRDGKAEVQVIRGANELTLFIIGKETVAIKERFRDFFREATGCDLIFESLTKSEKEVRREQLKRAQQKREQELQEQLRQREKEEQKKRIMHSLSSLDFEILELRKKGKSIHGICRELGVTKGKVEYKLNRMALIPELMEGVDKRFQPLTREERNRLRKTA